MGKLLKLKMILNKKNGQINMALPKRSFDNETRGKFKLYKKALMTFEGFE